MVINLHLISQPQQNYEIDLSENKTALLKRSEYDFMPYNSSTDVDYGYEQISSSNSHYDALGRSIQKNKMKKKQIIFHGFKSS